MDHQKMLPEIKKEDISLMAKDAHRKANSFYPVPKIISKRKIS
ncbi:iron-containing alcohol dehydrogenase [Shouchella patagoniensis]|nr:iron-containing alcohol dehydrogenase [Shouchella patagoniensis]